jgi:uncharacterized protein YegJ (DUF2314 family)
MVAGSAHRPAPPRRDAPRRRRTACAMPLSALQGREESMKQRARWPALIAGMALLGAACSKEPEQPAEPADEVTFMDDEAPAMRKAFARARRELDDFLAIAASPPAHLSDFAVKVGLRAGNKTEYVWIGDFELQSDDKYVGTINNDVQLTDEYKLGDRHSFGRSEIVDWIYLDNQAEKMHGNYTLCALLTQEDPDAAESMRKQYKLDCEL